MQSTVSFATILHKRSKSITYARSNHYIRQVELLHAPGCVDNHGPNAPKRRCLGTISAKLLMHLDENQLPERLNAPHLDAIREQRGAQALHTPGRITAWPGYFSRSAQMSQKDVGAGGIHPLAGATGSMLTAREVGLPVSVGIRAKGE